MFPSRRTNHQPGTQLKLFHSAAVAALFVFASSAQAAFVSCIGAAPNVAYNVLDNVSSATACTILAPLDGSQNDKVGGSNAADFTVNEVQFFGQNDWRFDGRFNVGGEEAGTIFDFAGGGQSGSFTLLSSLAAYEDVMLVFKDGQNTNLVGYLVDGAGTYTSPFENPPFLGVRNTKDVSHVSVYTRGTGGDIPGDTPGGTPVPEPATLALVGAALFGLAMTRRRKPG